MFGFDLKASGVLLFESPLQMLACIVFGVLQPKRGVFLLFGNYHCGIFCVLCLVFVHYALFLFQVHLANNLKVVAPALNR